ncbi:MAG: hypothetical protein IE916_03865 [Epsilonproteobacteria bacterium]|nr:hypothetical protein [Campylobacterota bacterium]
MPFLLLLIVLFIFALTRSEQGVALVVLMMVAAALFATYNKSFRDSLREFF